MLKSTKNKLLIILLCMLVFCLTLASCQIHKHEFGNEWKSDNDSHWQECSCTQRVNKAAHKMTEWKEITAATETSEGLKRAECEVCHKVVEETIPKLSQQTHSHGYDNGWKHDNKMHWQECSCGDKKNEAAHVVTNWHIDKNATEKEEGIMSGTCSVCQQKVTQTIPKINHSHNYGTSWNGDNNSHWKECSCGDKNSVGAHSVSSWTTTTPATEDRAGLQTGVCSVCNKTVTKTIPATGHNHQYSNQWENDADYHWNECSCGSFSNRDEHNESGWIIDQQATTTSTGLKHTECTVCGRVLRTETINKVVSTTREADFYAINDFHGATNKISQVGGYLKGRVNSNPNTVLINSGDMFQGSMESNSNYGKLLADCMTNIGFDAFTYGNHEFDWGLQNLKTLADSSDVPFLGANIYHWNANDKTWGTFADELAQEYVIKELDNGLKIGIIGVIGSSQITSISSNLVQTIGFKDPTPIIVSLSQKLRNQESCDIVVVSAHASSSQISGDDLTGYVDAVFCAHTHAQENGTYSNGIPYIQGGSYGSYVSNITFSVDANGNVTVKEQRNISYSSSWSNLSIVDQLVNNSNDKIKDEANQVLASIDNSLDYNTALPRLVCRAIAEYALSQNYQISLAMVNKARSTLNGGSVTYSKLYQAIPFDNVVYIAKVKGEDILNEARYDTNSVWRVEGAAIQEDEYYMIAVIDYLLFHQNKYRDYDYFPSFTTSGFEPIALTNDNYTVYNYRYITKDFLLKQSEQSSTLATDVYTVDSNANDRTKLDQTVILSSSYSESVNNRALLATYVVTEEYCSVSKKRILWNVRAAVG